MIADSDAKNRQEALFFWNDWWFGKEFSTGIRRSEYVDNALDLLKTRQAIVFSGIKRSGKSTIMMQMIRELLKANGPKNICYMNLDDAKFGNDLERIYDSYMQYANPEGKLFFFIDEAQNAPDWARWVKKMYDKKGVDMKFFISGSSSALLDGEYASLLAGRHFLIRVYPLSFREFLEFQGGIKAVPEEGWLSREKNGIMHHLEAYLGTGGFPEAVIEKDAKMKMTLLKSYFESILYRDVLARSEVRNAKTLEELALYLMSNVSSHFSFKNAAKLMGSSVQTMEEYFFLLKRAFLFFDVPIFSYKIKDQQYYPRKVYCMDNGMKNAVSFQFSDNRGRDMENLAAIELSRTGKKVFYWKGRGEVDFVIMDGPKTVQLIQVCYDLQDQDTKKREVASLLEAMVEFKLHSGQILTWDYEGEENIDGNKISYVPLWKWLLTRPTEA